MDKQQFNKAQRAYDNAVPLERETCFTCFFFEEPLSVRTEKGTCDNLDSPYHGERVRIDFHCSHYGRNPDA